MTGIIAGFGEVMLRLSPSGKLRMAQALPGTLEATFGGGEANVCASLSMLGSPARYLTVLPDNPVAAAFSAQLRGIGVDTGRIIHAPFGRMGVYYAEHGASQRGSGVIYDRENSAIALTEPDGYDFASMLEGCVHLHVTGITPALSEAAFMATLAMVEFAAGNGVKVSCDLNFRKKLWNWRPGVAGKQLASECMTRIVEHADIIIGNEEDAADVFGIHASGSAVDTGVIDTDGYHAVAEKLAERFPKAGLIAITLRGSFSADHNSWGGMLYERESGRSFLAPLDEDGDYEPYQIRNIVDRFGGGDSFCAGLLHALHDSELCAPADAIRFAVASSCLKHSIKGDYNYSSKAEVLALMRGSASGRVSR